MSQTIQIVLRVREDAAEEFERMFEETIVPMWKDFVARGRFVEASLTPVEDGTEVREGIRDYILHVEAEGMAAHTEFDEHPTFTEWLPAAQALQPEEPLVWFGTTRFRVPPPG